jgi:hypothetical protein
VLRNMESAALTVSLLTPYNVGFSTLSQRQDNEASPNGVVRGLLSASESPASVIVLLGWWFLCGWPK